MLFVVLAVIIISFYLIKKLSTSRSMKANKNLINVLAVHHLSPKEKIVLLKVVDDVILVGVTPQHISKISNIQNYPDFQSEENHQTASFSKYLSDKIKSPFNHFTNQGLDKGFQETTMKKEVQ